MEVDLLFKNIFLPELDSVDPDAETALDPVKAFQEKAAFDALNKRTGLADIGWDAPLTAAIAKSAPIEVSYRFSKSDVDFQEALAGIRRRWAE